eukprot:176965_1
MAIDNRLKCFKLNNLDNFLQDSDDALMNEGVMNAEAKEIEIEIEEGMMTKKKNRRKRKRKRKRQTKGDVTMRDMVMRRRPKKKRRKMFGVKRSTNINDLLEEKDRKIEALEKKMDDLLIREFVKKQKRRRHSSRKRKRFV